MKIFLKIAWRNIIRNKKRSAITVSAVAFGLGGLIFMWSFVHGAHSQMVNNFTDMMSGDMQIQHQGFLKKKSIQLLIKNPDEIEAIVAAEPRVYAHSKRIEIAGLLSSVEESSSAMIVGIEPECERLVTKVEQIVVEGEPLKEGDPDGVVIGINLARDVGLGIGDKAVVIAQGPDGSLTGEAFHVRGLFKSGSDFMDDWIIYAPLKRVQEMMTVGNGVSNIVMRMNKDDLPEVEKSFEGTLDGKEYDLLTWAEISPMTAQWIEFDNVFIFIIVIIVLIVVAAGILNTLLMSIMERLREFGMMVALGTKAYQISIIVTLESMFLSVVGMVVGVILGVLVTYYFNYVGINLARFTDAFGNFYIGTVVNPTVSFKHLTLSCVIVLLSSAVVSLYPAWRAMKLEPIEAMNLQ